MVLGPPVSVDGSRRPRVTARVLEDVTTDEGRLAVTVDGGATPGPEDLLLGLDSPESPFRRLDSPDPSWTRIAFRDEAVPVFSFHGSECLFRKGPRGREAVALLLFHRMLRLRSDVVFFHAASVGLGGRGVMIVGAKGAGKSTLALALAARGHDFLGDETAGFRPDTAELIPVRRPVGIKPGPRAAAVKQALDRLGRDPDRDGMLRVDVDTLLPAAAPRALPLAAVVFLAGFAQSPGLEEVAAGRDELARLQPFASSLVNAPAGRRVIELARMLAGVRAYRLSPGDPDATAALLESARGTPWA